MIKLLFFAVLVAAGQLMFKRVAQRAGDVSGTEALFRQIALDPWFIAAMGLYVGATLLWILALREYPLSRAYPFTALAFLLVPAGAAIFFGETLGPRYFAGLLLIIAGIALISGGEDPRYSAATVAANARD